MWLPKRKPGQTLRIMASLRTLLLLGALTVLAGCAVLDDSSESQSEAVSSSELAVTEVRGEPAYRSLSVEGGGFGQAGRLMKFFVDARERSAKKAYFINGNFKDARGQTPDYAKYHYDFAKKHLGVTEDSGTFNDNTYFVDDKRFCAGTIQTYAR